jgi:hypothetical protein
MTQKAGRTMKKIFYYSLIGFIILILGTVAIVLAAEIGPEES